MNTVKCMYCGEPIHPLRLEILPNTKTCVECSKESKKAGRLVSTGVGEEIEVNLEIVDSETYRKLAYLEKGYNPNETYVEDSSDYVE